MPDMMKICFPFACWLLVVAGLFAVEAVPMQTDQETNQPSVSSNCTESPAEEPQNLVIQSRASDEDSKEEPLREDAVSQEPDSEKRWRSYKQKFGKIYDSPEEEKSRQSIFEDNLRLILANNEQHNKGLISFKMGVNHLTDMTMEEFSQKKKGYKQNSLTGTKGSSFGKLYPQTSTIPLPSAVDWRSQGYVTPVKDQGGCGACWAFSVTGVLEGQIYRSTGSLVSLSEQNLIDCSSSSGTNGCAGRSFKEAYDYIKANGGIDTEESYPYKAVQSTCRFNASNVGAKVTGYMILPHGDELALKQAVATIGPIAVVIDYNHTSFKNYRSGIYDESSCTTTTLDHAVLIVGYGTLNGVDYWIVKNSWGSWWGEKGYVYMSRNRSNQCGIASSATYPTV